MKAIVCTGKGGFETLTEKQLDEPELRPDDILVEVKASAMNPVDAKARASGMNGEHERVLGYDASGVVAKLGANVTNWKVGDEVMFAGDISRNGTNAELVAVDGRICGKKPKSMTHAQAAALPLVYITAWELLFENLRLTADAKENSDLVFLMVNGAGGVGSAAIQLAKHVLGAGTVIASASRPETAEWCRALGATHIFNHHNDFEEELKKIGVDKVDVCFCGVDLDVCYDQIVKIMRPGGHIGSITLADSSKIDVSKLFFPNRLTLSFEMMFARPMLNTKPEQQGALLDKVSDLVDQGILKDIAKTHLKGGLSVDTIKEAQTLQESGKAIGKIVFEY